MDDFETTAKVASITRTLARDSVACKISISTGDDAPQTFELDVAKAVSAGEHLFSSLSDLPKEVFATRIIQVFVQHHANGKKVTETMFVPVPAWHMLSVYWQLDIEDYVRKTIRETYKPHGASPSGHYTIVYRKNGEAGPMTRSERFHDWLVAITARGNAIFYRKWVIFWDHPPMPPVRRPASETVAAS